MSNSPAIPRPDPRPESLPRAAVLRRRSTFEQLFSKGRRIGNRSLTFLILAPPSGPSGAVAFITPKRLGPAVLRNRLRRQLREIYRRSLPQLAPVLHGDLVILAKAEALKLDFVSLKQSFVDLYGKIAGKAENA